MYGAFIFQVYLGDYPEKHFTELRVQAAMETFKANLEQISAAIHNRNKGLPLPYEYLLPEKITNSITL